MRVDRARLERGQRAVAILAANFRGGEADDSATLFRLWGEEDPRGLIVGFYEASMIAFESLVNVTQESPAVVAGRTEQNLVHEGAQRLGSGGTSWGVPEFSAAILALRHVADDVIAAAEGIASHRNLTEGFITPADAAMGHYVLTWALAQGLGELWDVHPEVVCQRLALQLAKEGEES